MFVIRVKLSGKVGSDPDFSPIFPKTTHSKYSVVAGVSIWVRGVYGK